MTPINQLVSSKNGAQWKLRVGLSCWLFGLSTLALGRTASRSKCFWTHRWPPPLSPRSLYSCVHCSSTGVANERAWLKSQTRSFLILAFSMMDVLLWSLPFDTAIFALHAHPPMSIHKLPPHISLYSFPIFSFLFLLGPCQPSKALITAN